MKDGLSATEVIQFDGYGIGEFEDSWAIGRYSKVHGEQRTLALFDVPPDFTGVSIIRFQVAHTYHHNGANITIYAEGLRPHHHLVKNKAIHTIALGLKAPSRVLFTAADLDRYNYCRIYRPVLILEPSVPF